jgi:Uncharacterized conserved protein (DUF2358)
MRSIYWIPAFISALTAGVTNGYLSPRIHKSYLGREEKGIILSSSKGYDETGAGAKAIVSGLTWLSNAIFPDSKGAVARSYAAESLTPIEVFEGVVKDFENGYLFSGQIDSEIYAEDCVFTDPTLSFRGLSTFERNIASLKPILDRFVGDTLVVLYDCQLDAVPRKVKATWRMSGAVKLPWNPRIELTGNTAMTFDPEQGGRIVDYFERWDIPATDALLQLLRPAKKAEMPNIKDFKPFNQRPASDRARSSSSLSVNVRKTKLRIAEYAALVKPSDMVSIDSDNAEPLKAKISELVMSLIRAGAPPSAAETSSGESTDWQVLFCSSNEYQRNQRLYSDGEWKIVVNGDGDYTVLSSGSR